MALVDGQNLGAVPGSKVGEYFQDRECALNACVMDYLYLHPDLIPDDWKDKKIYFWGTIFRFERIFMVGYLEVDGDTGKWERCYRRIAAGPYIQDLFTRLDVAACLAA